MSTREEEVIEQLRAAVVARLDAAEIYDEVFVPLLDPDFLELELEVERLRAALFDAADDIESWGAYASDYFRWKWDLAGDVARYKALAEGSE